jgi:hypothetical protein
MLKKAHFYADSCLELIEDLEDEGEADSLDEVKETMEELKNNTPEKLSKLFADKSESNGVEAEKVDDDEDADDDDDADDSEADSDDESEFPLASKPVSAKRYQKLLEGEKKKIVELCKLDIGSDEPQDMDIEN